jgi:hypothetical protein
VHRIQPPQQEFNPFMVANLSGGEMAAAFGMLNRIPSSALKRDNLKNRVIFFFTSAINM